MRTVCGLLRIGRSLMRSASPSSNPSYTTVEHRCQMRWPDLSRCSGRSNKPSAEGDCYSIVEDAIGFVGSSIMLKDST